MSAIEVVEGLLQVGMAMKSAWTKARAKEPALTWQGFLATSEFEQAFALVSGLLKTLAPSEIENALTAIRTKEAALLGGRSVIELPTDKLAQFDALLDVENQLMRRFATQAGRSAEWVSWLIDDALPVLVKVAKVVIPLLL